MPNFDKTGPVGKGPKTGHEQGSCDSAPLSEESQKSKPQVMPVGCGRGQGVGRGRGQGRECCCQRRRRCCPVSE